MISNRSALALMFLLVTCSWAADVHADENTQDEELEKIKRQLEAAKGETTDAQTLMLIDIMQTFVERIELLGQRVGKVDDIVASITEEEQQSGRSYLDILGSMELDDPDKDFSDTFSSFRDHFMRSVQGHLVIDNLTEHNLSIMVNGVRHDVPKYRVDDNAVSIIVPFGKLKTQLEWRDPVNGYQAIEKARTIGSDVDSEWKWKLVQDSKGKIHLILPLKIRSQSVR